MSFSFETRSPVETARLAAKHCDFKTSLPSVPSPAPFVPEMLATIRHTPKRIRRLSHAGVDHFRRRKPSGEEPEDFAAPPEFTIPDYKESTTRTPVEEVSPLDEGSMPKSKRSRKSSVASSVSSEASSTLPRRRRSSVTSVAESFSSNKEKVTFVMKAKAFPLTISGFFSSFVCLIAAFIGLSLVGPAPNYQAPPPRPKPARVAAANQSGDDRRPSLFKRLLQKCRGSFKHITSSKAVEAPVQPASSPAKRQAPAVFTAWRRHIKLPACQWRRHMTLVSKFLSTRKLRKQQQQPASEQQPEAAHPAPAIVCSGCGRQS
ncbi:hypothetical protein MIND_00270700 [Mycena indigotica]|uniref:Uncharacterized protein n=1 Tax=Mycena indigotica TaxID=2126181 RepID=A0A8H6T9S9_9AGAR|nr:uncharacterized protein MIND_00270700 [Mycena indigotica]KAF7312567.1 hypothetical protein MIND_00270700 [Mycena indigotica]